MLHPHMRMLPVTAFPLRSEYRGIVGGMVFDWKRRFLVPAVAGCARW